MEEIIGRIVAEALFVLVQLGLSRLVEWLEGREAHAGLDLAG